MIDYYEILGVSRQASSGEVRQAYMRLAKERHPDRFSDPGEKQKAHDFFKELTAAFNTLSHDRNRQEYDKELARPKLTTPEEIAQDAHGRGLKSFEGRDYHEAVNFFRIAVDNVPQTAQYHAALARALAKNPNWMREAIQEMEKAGQLAPKNAAFQADLASLLLGQGLKLRARKVAEAALLLAPENPEVLRVASEAGVEPEPEPKSGGGLRGLLRRKS